VQSLTLRQCEENLQGAKVAGGGMNVYTVVALVQESLCLVIAHVIFKRTKGVCGKLGRSQEATELLEDTVEVRRKKSITRTRCPVNKTSRLYMTIWEMTSGSGRAIGEYLKTHEKETSVSTQ